jgi:hypothetical protein
MRKLEFVASLAQAFLMHCKNREDCEYWISLMIHTFSVNVIAESLQMILLGLGENESVFFWEIERFPWNKFLHLMNNESRFRLFSNCRPCVFVGLKVDSVSDEVIAAALKRNEIVRAFVETLRREVNLIDFMKGDANWTNRDVMSGIELFESEYAKWSSAVKVNDTLRFLGSVLCVGELHRLAFALFVVMKDERKILSMLNLESELVLWSKEYVEVHRDGPYADVIQAALDMLDD